MSHTVIGIFKSFTEASVAKQHLENNGFSSSDIDVNDSNYTATDYSGNDTTGGVTDVTAQASTHVSEHKDDDSIGGFFRNLFSSDDDDEELTNRHIEAGKRGTVVTVHARSYDQAERAADMLDEFGAVNVNDSDDWDTVDGDSNFGLDSATTSTYADMPAGDATPIGGFATTGATDFDNASLSDIESTTSAAYKQDDLSGTTNPDSIKVVEENLHVGKEEVQTGGVRLRSRIVERPVEENIRLRQERVTVTRTLVDRPALESDFDTFQEGTVEMTESAEIPVISKDARVVEEISLNKEVTESDQTIIDTVRHTEVDTENLDPDHKDRNIL